MKLYKYHTVNKNLVWSLSNSKNWYSKLLYLNDPYEVFFEDNTGTEVYKNFKEKLCVCSFSKNKEEILMWSHYADEHRGVCLEFDCIEDDDFNGSIHHINYDNKISSIQEVKVTKTGHLSINLDSNGKWLNQKLETWKYEDEARKIMIEENSNLKGVARDFPGKLIAIYFGINASQFDIDLVKKITKDYEGLKYFRVKLGINSGKMSVQEEI
ncbi:DUF2971 domain-containing protein [Winogradskyella sp. DF17]|uniref:DUF2971 domain-containing protein n=1 Tax=Winogradskyella pelagia TaxID=2819984 RepID=A0ABS3SX96_9FLAO|nr:DUF2971 domain-containing protein [Winogradskyella sp. DF17]MBO3115108.1 DUF2971 domain-containing protein [Winogradskyella sp. DF17]